MPYPSEMQESIRKKVEPTRQARLEQEFRRLELSEKAEILENYHPDFRQSGKRKILFGPNQGDLVPYELAELITAPSRLDPGAVDTLEYLHAGDTAIVSTQYSYLPSWITILVEPNRSREAAVVLFQEIYDYWKTLPHDNRPKLYLQGLSLGALGSEECADLFTLFEDPIHGALWSGPPFPSSKWSDVTNDRNPDSPAWLPKFRDGTMVRFTARENAIDEAGERWGPMRLIYLQHASDPMTFFAPELLYRKPAWLVGARGPDVSPYLDWYPIVTFLQIACDLPMATSVPAGYGHNIAPASYIDAWIAVTAPRDWSGGDTERLKQLF